MKLGSIKCEIKSAINLLLFFCCLFVGFLAFASVVILFFFKKKRGWKKIMPHAIPGLEEICLYRNLFFVVWLLFLFSFWLSIAITVLLGA